MNTDRCYACNRPLSEAGSSTLVVTEDGQPQYVGEDCAAKVFAAGTAGYQPPLGGPKLFVLNKGPEMRS